MSADRVKAVVFDMDGVLIDAKDWHYEALDRALELFGFTIDRQAHLSTFDGLPTRRKLQMLSVAQGLPEGLHSLINELKQGYTIEISYAKCRPVFALQQALSRLKAEGYRLAVCSNSIRRTVETMMQLAALDGYLDLMLSNEDVTQAKPDPEMYLSAMQRLDLQPQECLIVEDNDHGIQAARASGGHVMVVGGVGDVVYDRIKAEIARAEGRRGMIVLAPIAGESAHFPPEEYAYPKPLIEVAGRPMIGWAIDNLSRIAPDVEFVFIASREEARRYSYERIFDLATDGHATTLTLNAPTAGALCSCLMAIDAIDHDQPLVIANSDQLIEADLAGIVGRFEEAGADAGVITFDSLHPRWSYVQTDAEGRVSRASEKEVISRHAIAGFYYFRRAGLFFQAAVDAMRHASTTNGRYYISASLNELILAGHTVRAQSIAASRYHSFYHPKNIESFQMSGASALHGGMPTQPINLVVPAAGLGSRFAAAGYDKPKPFIDVDGKPMIQRVLDNLATPDAQVTVLLQADHMRNAPDMAEALRAQGVDITPVDKLTEGTACTLLLARRRFDDDAPLLVANSDQVVDFDIKDFVRDCFERELDGSILVFEDAERNPKWSFAKLGPDGLVERVAEKDPISAYATVGIYLFRRGRDFIAAAVDMIARNERVNNEFYTCPVFNYAIRNGLKIGLYEIPASAMHGLGTPEDLKAYLAR